MDINSFDLKATIERIKASEPERQMAPPKPRKRRTCEYRRDPSRNPFFRAYHATEEEWQAHLAKRKHKRGGRPVGVAYGYRKDTWAKHVDEMKPTAQALAQKIISNYPPEELYGAEAIEVAAEIMMTDNSKPIRLMAARILLEWTKRKPGVSNEDAMSAEKVLEVLGD